MRIGSVFASEFLDGDRRLNGSYYLSEDEVSMRQLRAWKGPRACLGDLAPEGRIFSGGIFRMIEAADAEHGCPYISAKDLVRADVRASSFISRQHGDLLKKLRIREGQILLTCSGMNLGKAIWARRDIAGFCASGDLIRVNILDSFESPGYVFAFLASRFGWVCLRQLIFGGNIKHIEPRAVARIGVPRIGSQKESEIHELVMLSAQMRSESAELRNDVIANVEAWLGWKRKPLRSLTSSPRSTTITRRLDAFHHADTIEAARSCLAKNSVPMGSKVESVFEPNRGARHKVDRNGVPFLSSSAVFQLTPTAEYMISKRTPQIDRLILAERDCLLPRSGQIGGIIGRAVLPVPSIYGWAASEHLVRIRCHCKEDAMYLWGIMASQPGYYATIGTAFGSSIPSLDCTLLSELGVPWADGKIKAKIVHDAEQAIKRLALATEYEQRAIELVSAAIGGSNQWQR